MTRSATDISLMWSLLYLVGTVLSFAYLVIVGAVAGKPRLAMPLVVW